MQFVRSAVFSAVLAVSTAGAMAVPTYVGSFNVFDGPVWTSNPTVLSAKEAAALLYGGSAMDYAISVLSSLDPTTITNTAWLDGYGDTQYLFTPADDDYKLSSRADNGYDSYPSFSAWVCDHANCQAYGFPENSGYNDLNYTNYVWRVNAVPEPATLALVGLALGGLTISARRRRQA